MPIFKNIRFFSCTGRMALVFPLWMMAACATQPQAAAPAVVEPAVGPAVLGSVVWPAASGGAVVNAADGVTVTIAAIVRFAAAWEGRVLRLKAAFQGWRGACRGAPPSSRSDWMVHDATGCLYVHGRLPAGLQSNRSAWRTAGVARHH